MSSKTKKNNNSAKVNKNKKTKIVHWNCNSVSNKIEEFKMFCEKYKPDIISLNETKITDEKANYILQIDNYTTIHKARNSTTKNGAGGVALIVKNNVKFSECKFFDEMNLEILAINVNISGVETCVITYYNPPQDTLRKSIFEKLNELKIKYILLGDLNAKSTLWLSESNNANGDILNEITINQDCIIVNTKEATHYSFNRE